MAKVGASQTKQFLIWYLFNTPLTLKGLEVTLNHLEFDSSLFRRGRDHQLHLLLITFYDSLRAEFESQCQFLLPHLLRLIIHVSIYKLKLAVKKIGMSWSTKWEYVCIDKFKIISDLLCSILAIIPVANTNQIITHALYILGMVSDFEYGLNKFRQLQRDQGQRVEKIII